MKTELNLFQLSQKRGNYYLTEAERLDVLHRLQSGQKPAEICSAYGITKQTVSAIKIKAKKFGSVADRPRTGRPRVTTPLEDRHIYLLSVRSPQKTPKLIKSDLNLNVNRRTVRRRLNEFKLMPSNLMPAYDFNPIENLWAYLDSHIPVTERCNKTRFLSAIMKTWNEIPSEYLKSLVNSVPNRLFKAIRSKGQPIGY